MYIICVIILVWLVYVFYICVMDIDKLKDLLSVFSIGKLEGAAGIPKGVLSRYLGGSRAMSPMNSAKLVNYLTKSLPEQVSGLGLSWLETADAAHVENPYGLRKHPMGEDILLSSSEGDVKSDKVQSGKVQSAEDFHKDFEDGSGSDGVGDFLWGAG